MNTLTFHYVLALGLTAAMTFTLAVAILAIGPKSRLHRTFAIFNFFIAIWSSGGAAVLLSANQDIAWFWLRFEFFGVALIPASFLDFVFALLERVERRYRVSVSLGYLYGLGSLPFLFLTTLILSRPEPKLSLPFYPDPGPILLPFFVLWILFILIGLQALATSYRAARGNRRVQIGLVLSGTIIGYLGGGGNWLPTWDIALFPYNPFGTYGVPIYSALIAYAILRYQLFSLSPPLAAPSIIKSVADALLVADAAGKIAITNRAAAMLLAGEEANEQTVVGKPLDQFLPSAHDLWGRAKELPRNHDRLLVGEEASLRLAAGSTIPISLSAAAVRDPTGEVIGLTTVIRDLRKTKEFIRQLESQKKALEEANKKLAERTEEAERLNKLAVGRELKMIELKQRIRELENREN